MADVELAGISHCSGDTRHNEGNYAEGDLILLCCKLSEEECINTSMNDALTLLGQGSPIMNRIGNCTVMLTKSNATVSDSGNYLCYKNDNMIMIKSLSVWSKPNIPNIMSLTVSEDGTIIVNAKNLTNYTGCSISLIEDGTSSPLQECSVSKSHDSDNVCTCHHNFFGENYFTNKAYIIKLKVFKPSKNPVTSLETDLPVNFINIILPGPVEHLQLFNVTANEAFISFRSSIRLRNYSKWMRKNEKPLIYKLILNSKHGTQVTNRLEMQFSQTFSDSDYADVFIHFHNLNSFTTYEVGVTACGGGGEGAASFLNFSTLPSVPVSPPEIAAYSYVTGLDKCVQIFWKAIPSDLRGGRQMSYAVDLLSETNQTFENSSVYFKACNLSSNHDIVARIWSVNEMGHSDKSANVTISKNSVADPIATIVELNKHQGTLYFDPIKFRVVENVSVYFCSNGSNNHIGGCLTMYPGMSEAWAEMSNISHAQFNFTLKSKNLTNEITYNTTVTTYVQQDSTKQLKLNSNSENLTAFGKRTEIHETESVNIENYSEVLVAFKQNGVWRSLQPASCYFAHNSDGVDLNVTYQITEQGKVLLTVQQACDYKYPKYFLARRFHIYFSIDEQCLKNYSKIQVMTNELFQMNQKELTYLTNIICVVAIGLNGRKSQKYHIYIKPKQDYNDYSGNQKGIIIFIIIIIMTAVILMSVIVFIKCKKRRQYFSTFQNEQVDRSTNIALLATKSISSRDSGIETNQSPNGVESFSQSFRNDSTSTVDDQSDCMHSGYNNSSHGQSDNSSGCGNSGRNLRANATYLLFKDYSYGQTLTFFHHQESSDKSPP